MRGVRPRRDRDRDEWAGPPGRLPGLHGSSPIRYIVFLQFLGVAGVKTASEGSLNRLERGVMPVSCAALTRNWLIADRLARARPPRVMLYVLDFCHSHLLFNLPLSRWEAPPVSWPCSK